MQNGAPVRIPGLGASNPGGMTCGQCQHGHSVSLDLRSPLECRANPPTVAIVGMGRDGNPVVWTGYPRPNRQAPSCGRFALRLGREQGVSAPIGEETADEVPA